MALTGTEQIKSQAKISNSVAKKKGAFYAPSFYPFSQIYIFTILTILR